MKKLLSILATVSLTATVTSTIVACGTHPAPTKGDLKNVIKNVKVNGNDFNTEEAVLDEILKLNDDSGVTKNDVEIKEFIKAEVGEDGSAKIVAVDDSNFTGSVDVTITAKKIENDDIIREINNNSYEITVGLKSSLAELKASIDEGFIKKGLSELVRKAFNNDLFKLKAITDEENRELTDADFETIHSFDAKIKYNYGDLEEQSVGLKITVSKDQLINDKFELNDGNVNVLIEASNGKIYAGTEHGNIWEINLDNNQKVNKYHLNQEHVSSLIEASNGKIYATTIKNNIWEIDLKTEAVRELEGFDDRADSTSLLEFNNKLYVGTGAGNVYEIDLNSGETFNYGLEDGGKVNVLVKASNDKIYAGTEEGKLWEIDTVNQKSKLEYEFKSKSNKILDIIEVDKELVLAVNNWIYKYDFEKHELKEMLQLTNIDNNISGLVKGEEGIFYAFSNEGMIIKINFKDGMISQQHPINTSLYSLLIIHQDTYVGTKTSVWKLGI